jgi:diguanylate cyclase (GGDEF)-like protein/PAS domain S-box-containing protein
MVRQIFPLLVTVTLLLLAGSLWADDRIYRVGIEANPPLAFIDDAGKPSGLFPELLNEAGREHGFLLRYVPCNWAECFRQLEGGQIDLLAPVAYTPERNKIFDFLETTVLSNWGQIFVPPRSEISSILDLDGRRIATLARDVFLEGPDGLRSLAHKFDLKIEIITVKDYDEALTAVVENRADAGLVNRIFGAWHREEFALKPSSILISPVDIRVAFARGHATELRARLDSVFGEWKNEKNSVYHRLVGKWLSPAGKAQFVPVWFVPLLWSLVALLLVMWIAILLARRRLKIQALKIAAKNQQLEKELQERQRAEAKLEERQRQYRVLFEENHSILLLIDPEDERIVDANPAACHFYGYTREALMEMPLSHISTTAPQDITAMLSTVTDEGEHKFESVHRLADGGQCEVEACYGPLVVGGRKLLCAVIHDISERRRFEYELTEKHEFLQTVIDGVVDPILVISTDYRLLMMNKVAAESLPDTECGIDELCCHELLHHSRGPCGGDEHPCPLEEVKATGKTVTMTYRHCRGDEVRIVELTASPLWNADGSLRGIIEASHDITERIKAEELVSAKERRLQHMTHHDSLTDLPNRMLFEDRLRHALVKAQRNRNMMALMFIDLDRFKNINDTLGHETGDKLLVEIGRRLAGAVREMDTVARLGGDEFLVLLEQVDSFQAVTTMAQRIREELGRIAEIDTHQLVAAGSIGISIFPDDARSAEELIKCADVAMHHAKSEGKDNYQFYTPRMNARAHEMLLLERDLRRALEDGQLCLYYQPQVELKTGLLIGVEALLRWKHPQQGLVPPADFIPLAEETGLIVPIGEWVLREACRQQVEWLKQGFPALRMAVNISGRQLKQRDFIETVDLVLTETGIVPESLELEITESIIMQDVQATIMELTDLRMRGIRLSIDDFGTGYSSLSYLNRFPVDQLKIDRSFIFRLAGDNEPVMIVDAVIALGRSMDLEVIAEGIESRQQMQILDKRGCQLGQGFLFSRPVPESELREKFLVALHDKGPGEPPGFRFNFPELDA